jgi:predicted deacylase
MAHLDIDWTRGGRQATYLHLAHSSNESAWKSVRVPFFLLKNGQGPTTLLLGGCHGDEYEGPAALSRFVHNANLSKVQGTIIVAPAINPPAVQAGARLSPLDGRNLNREFPGSPTGSITQRLAHFLATEIVPRCDAVVDLHSGGRSLRFEPCTFIHSLADERRNAELIAAARSFGAPLTVVVNEPHASVMIDNVVEKAGKIMIATELGGAGVLSRDTSRLARLGVSRLLGHLGNYRSEDPPPEVPSRLVHAADQSFYVHADFTAVVEPTVDCGEDVERGQIVGYLHRLESVDMAPVPLHAPRSGVVLCLNGQGRVERDDTILVVASDYRC